MPPTTTSDLSTFFRSQLAYYKVEAAQLAEPVPRASADPDGLVLSWYPAGSDLQPLRVERNHIAVYALRHLALGPRARLLVTGPPKERVVLLIGDLSMGAGAQITLAMRTDLIVDRWQGESGDADAGHVLLTGEPGVDGENGASGAPGMDGLGVDHPGGSGTAGGAANHAGRGQDSSSALIAIGHLGGDTLFEVSAGAGGTGGAGGGGGKGGAGGRDAERGRRARGGNGGPGGPGGHGGPAGNGGRMRVWIHALAPGAHWRTRAEAPAGGRGGAGGARGIPGLGHPDGALGQPGVPGNAGAPGAPGIVELNLA